MTRARENADGARLDAPLISPALVTPNLGTPSAGVMTNVTGMPASALSASGISSSKFLKGDNTWDTAGSTSASDLDSGTLGTARMPAGSLVQTTTVTSGITNTTMSATSNTWTSSVITKAITPLYDDSDIIINATFGVFIQNNTSDGGYALKWTRAISGGATSNPVSINMYGSTDATTGSYSNFYRGHAGGAFHSYVTYVGMDSPATDSAVTYTLEGASYASDLFQIGSVYNNRWHIYIMEVKR